MRRNHQPYLWIILILISSSITVADISSNNTLSPVQEARYQELLEELRCLVCQNQSLAESNAELAGDLRTAVLNMVVADKSNQEIFSFMTERYGSFVRYRPPFNPTTLFLWLAPFMVLIIVVIVLFRYIAKQNKGGK